MSFFGNLGDAFSEVGDFFSDGWECMKNGNVLAGIGNWATGTADAVGNIGLVKNLRMLVSVHQRTLRSLPTPLLSLFHLRLLKKLLLREISASTICMMS